jgi:hypothetical protein
VRDPLAAIALAYWLAAQSAGSAARAVAVEAFPANPPEAVILPLVFTASEVAPGIVTRTPVILVSLVTSTWSASAPAELPVPLLWMWTRSPVPVNEPSPSMENATSVLPVNVQRIFAPDG